MSLLLLNAKNVSYIHGKGYVLSQDLYHEGDVIIDLPKALYARKMRVRGHVLANNTVYADELKTTGDIFARVSLFVKHDLVARNLEVLRLFAVDGAAQVLGKIKTHQKGASLIVTKDLIAHDIEAAGDVTAKGHLRVLNNISGDNISSSGNLVCRSVTSRSKDVFGINCLGHLCVWDCIDASLIRAEGDIHARVLKGTREIEYGGKLRVHEVVDTRHLILKQLSDPLEVVSMKDRMKRIRTIGLSDYGVLTRS